MLATLALTALLFLYAVHRSFLPFYHSRTSAYEDVETFSAFCVGPAGDVSWGIYLKSDMAWRERQSSTRDPKDPLRTRACFLTDAQRTGWIKRFEELDFARRHWDSFQHSRVPDALVETGWCGLGISSHGDSYDERWPLDAPASEETRRLHADLMRLGWPTEFASHAPPERLLVGLESWPPADCEGKPLPGYEDAAASR